MLLFTIFLAQIMAVGRVPYIGESCCFSNILLSNGLLHGICSRMCKSAMVIHGVYMPSEGCDICVIHQCNVLLCCAM